MPNRVERESPLSLTLVQGISRGERMDWVVQKATELGVAELVPVLTERSVVKLNGSQAERKREHWLGIAIAACEQCGRNRVPRIHAPVDFGSWLAPATRCGTRILLDASGSNALGGLRRTPADHTADRPGGRAVERRARCGAGGRLSGVAPRAPDAAHRNRCDRCARGAAAAGR